MQKGPEVGGLTFSDIQNGHSGCESLGSHTRISERGLFTSVLLFIDILLLPAIRFNVVRLVRNDKMVAVVLSAVETDTVVYGTGHKKSCTPASSDYK